MTTEMLTPQLQKEMSVYDLATMMMEGFMRVKEQMANMEAKMATKEDLENLRKEVKTDIADTNRRLDGMKLYIPSLI
jgi:hypothetical protein